MGRLRHKTEYLRVVAFVLAFFLLSGCGEAPSASAAGEDMAPEVLARASAPAYPDFEEIYRKAKASANGSTDADPAAFAPGMAVEKNEKALIDYSNASDGYISVCYTAPTDTRLKVQIKLGETTYTYNLDQGEWTVFPLSLGDGRYVAAVYENISGTKYALVLSAEIDVKLKDQFAPFLRSNQYVDYARAPVTVEVAKLLAGNTKDPFEAVAVVFAFVTDRLDYDSDLAKNVKTTYRPDMDYDLEKRTGICFDYASIMTGMLRSLGIPCKLVTGYAGEAFHAWISVWSEQEGWIDVVYFDGNGWQRMDPTFADTASNKKAIAKYIGDGTNYAEKFYY